MQPLAPVRKTLPFLVLAGLAWPLSAWTYQSGVLTAKASAEPGRIPPDGKTQITVETSDGFQKPIPMASIKLSTDTGYFELSGHTSTQGFTDKDGRFQAVWHGNLRTVPGTQVFEVTATKGGYISKYPVTASVKVAIEDPAKASPKDTPETAKPERLPFE